MAFQREVEFAKANKDQYVEVDEDVINFKFGGLNGCKHVMYNSLMIFPTGTADQALKDMNTSLEEKMMFSKAKNG